MAAAKTLAGKVALVTGSTSGIGLAMIRALAAAGADVGLHGFGDAKTIQGIQVSGARGMPRAAASHAPCHNRSMPTLNAAARAQITSMPLSLAGASPRGHNRRRLVLVAVIPPS
jgi:NAD(P)-dependent dehydrogenase (short-subunit alcohol dehydrogenase family)